MVAVYLFPGSTIRVASIEENKIDAFFAAFAIELTNLI